MPESARIGDLAVTRGRVQRVALVDSNSLVREAGCILRFAVVRGAAGSSSFGSFFLASYKNSYRHFPRRSLDEYEY